MLYIPAQYTKPVATLSVKLFSPFWSQVPLLSLLFLVLSVMNSATLFTVVYKRPKKKNVEKYKSL